MYKNIKVFEGLNALRFLAAYFVILDHGEQIRLTYGLYNVRDYSLFNNGSTAVTFFFVLSGFLITFLLLKELAATKTISVSKFYLRRVFRIWPLYFLLVLAGTLIIPSALDYIEFEYHTPYNFSESILYFTFFMPFVINILHGRHLLYHLWSIGVEEIFYLAWAPISKILKGHFLKLIAILLSLKIGINILAYLGYFNPFVTNLIELLRFEAMIIGAFGAYYLFNTNRRIETRWYFSRMFQLIAWVFIVSKLFFSRYLTDRHTIFDVLYNSPVISELVLMVLFLWVIICISVNNSSFITLRSKSLEYLGDISYGIYMYHTITIGVVTVFLSQYLNSLNPLVSSLAYYLIITLLVILVSGLSKSFYENWFLTKKKKFE